MAIWELRVHKNNYNIAILYGTVYAIILDTMKYLLCCYLENKSCYKIASVANWLLSFECLYVSLYNDSVISYNKTYSEKM